MAISTSARREWIGSAIDQYQGRLIRFASRITGDVESARDVLQDTFLRLCREDLDRVRDHPRRPGASPRTDDGLTAARRHTGGR